MISFLPPADSERTLRRAAEALGEPIEITDGSFTGIVMFRYVGGALVEVERVRL